MGLPVEVNPLLIKSSAATATTISNSLRYRASASAYLNRTFGTPTDSTKMTFSFWVKRGNVNAAGSYQVVFSGTGNYTAMLYFDYTSSGTFEVNVGNNSNAQYNFVSSRVFRDTTAWYHIVVVIDTNNATAANRCLLYVNGEAATWGTAPTIPLGFVPGFNTAAAKAIGRNNNTSSYYFDGYLTDFYLIDGQALTPSSFGLTDTTTGVWSPKTYSGTYGNNGFYLKFSDNSAVTATAIGKDSSGNGNNWTPNNISLTSGVTYDSMIDSPTVYDDGSTGRGNYATLIPSYSPTDSSASLSYGNLRITGTTSYVLSSIAIPTSGKWYCEMTAVSVSYGFGFAFGIRSLDLSINDVYVVMRAASNNYSINKGTATLASWSNIPAGAVLGCAFDNDAGTLNIYSNNVLIFTVTGIPNVPSTTSNWHFHVAGDSVSDVNDMNFGQRPFTYSPPSGYKALNTYNLPTPTILKGNQYMDATTYTGNNSTNVITNSGSMQPDMVWIKSRSSVTNHMLNDSVRGAGKDIFPNLTSAESTTNILTSFNSTGFTLSADGGGAGNGNGLTYVGWQWKKGATPGFDIVSYTGNGTSGRTISHSLGATPALMIIKNRSNGGVNYEWFVYHKNMNATPQNGYLLLNSTAAYSTSGGVAIWNNTAPTSSVFTLGNGNTNINTNNYIAYLWAEIAGFSKFGSYTGNGNADGPIVNCGFRPRFILWKRSDAGGQDWGMIDSSRSTYNTAGAYLLPSSTAAEGTFTGFDFLSNGFKLREASAVGTNYNAAIYIYMAFAENPFKYARAR
jgi:hypothetical protein